MESESYQEYKKLVDEITKGAEQVNQHRASSSSPNQERILDRMMASYEEALSILNRNTFEGQTQPVISSSSNHPDSSVSVMKGFQQEDLSSGSLDRMMASYEEDLSILNRKAFEGQTQPVITSSSNHPDSSVSVMKGFQQEDLSSVSKLPSDKKRKSSIIHTEVVYADELPNDGYDGYNWRKYGQKDILNHKYPRSYYRCVYRMSQGCTATKQVQRFDEDHNKWEITYAGKHRCTHQPVAPRPAVMKKQMEQLSPQNLLDEADDYSFMDV